MKQRNGCNVCSWHGADSQTSMGTQFILEQTHQCSLYLRFLFGEPDRNDQHMLGIAQPRFMLPATIRGLNRKETQF